MFRQADLKRFLGIWVLVAAIGFGGPAALALACEGVGEEEGPGGGGGGCTAAPTAITDPASFVTETGAQLNGFVSPNGCLTTYKVLFGTSSPPPKEPPVKSGTLASETSGEPIEAFLVTLSPHTTYYFRITAMNGKGTTEGSIQSFKTEGSAKPIVKTTEGLAAETTATLHGTVNPNGLETSYYFKWGITAEYGHTTATENAGSGKEAKSVSAGISGLSPGSTYHFQLYAKNSAGTSEGGDKTFTTTAPKSPAWSLQSTPNPTGAVSSRLAFVSCSGSTACTSVGEYVSSSAVQGPLGERWGGTSWVAQTPPNPASASSSELVGDACPSATWCGAVGFSVQSGVHRALAERWNGSEWSVQTTPEPSGATSSELEAISCSSSASCTAVGHYTTSSLSGTLIEYWNGTSWAVQTSPNPSGATSSSLLGVSCVSSSVCIAVGDYYNASEVRLSLAEAWNGVSWTVQPVPNRTGATKNILLGISCSASTSCSAVGGDYPSGGGPQETLVEHWNGVEWIIQTSANPSGSTATVLHGISCISSTSCMAVGDYVSSGSNLTLAESWNGSSWTIKSTPNPTGAIFSALWSVACTSSTECYAPGYYEVTVGSPLAMTERFS